MSYDRSKLYAAGDLAERINRTMKMATQSIGPETATNLQVAKDQSLSLFSLLSDITAEHHINEFYKKLLERR